MEPGLDVHGPAAQRPFGPGIGKSALVLDTSPGPYRDILRVADIMSKDVVTATLNDTIFSVAQKMSRQIASVSSDATVVDAARLMSTANISCLVVMHGPEVAGIITEKDLLKRVVALHRDPTQTRVADVMSCPVVSVPSSWSILSASKKMETLHFHRLLVMDDKTVRGIITQTDIMRAIRGAFDAVESQRRAMEAELSDVVQRVILDMQRMRGVLQDLPGSSAQDDATARTLPPADDSPVSGPVSLL
ncbi:MAG: CBS domain-containing protein [Planctomycetes bacterium]|nr:CBS domain-containing protein [Planctomycetota bacterium]